MSGGFREKEIPVPIPNTEVKLFIADGTMRFAAWESRTLPDAQQLSYYQIKKLPLKG
jgi:hypothetical protein